MPKKKPEQPEQPAASPDDDAAAANAEVVDRILTGEVLTPAEAERVRRGRQSSYTEEMADYICDRIANGESLRRICEDDGMPDRNTVLRWLREFKDFTAKYARAREDQAEFEHDVMREIENAALRGQVDPKAANVVLGNKRWRMEKLKPKVFGAKVEVEHSGKIELAETLRAARERLSGN